MTAKGDQDLSRRETGHDASTESTPETRTASALWTPQDVAAHLPDAPLVSSQGTADWEGSVVERRRQRPWETMVGPMTHHLVGLVLEPPPFYFWRDMGGEVKEGLRVPGSITIFPAGQPFRAHWDRTEELLNIHLSPQLLEHVAQPFLANSERIEMIPVFTAPDPQIEFIGRAMLAELEQGAPGGRLFGESLATALAVHLLRHYIAFPATIPNITHKWIRTEIRRAREYVHDHLDRDLSLQEIADVSGVSANYLTSLFKETTGYSLHQYVIQQRVEKAKSLLRRSDLSIGEIAQRVGFYDSSHLTRHFKRLTGITPRTMRQ
jgi:AraC family transcriptional regulator